MHFYTHEDVKKAVALGKLKIMKHPTVTVILQIWVVDTVSSDGDFRVGQSFILLENFCMTNFITTVRTL